MKETVHIHKGRFVILCTCMLVLLAVMMTVGAVRASAAPDTHTHNACGATSCTHDGTAHSEAITYTELTKNMILNLPTVTLSVSEAGGLNTSPFFVIPEGNYYLSEDINTRNDSGNYLLVQGDVTLCLNGHSLLTFYIFVQDGTLTVCDCSAEQTGVLYPSSGNYGIEVGKNPDAGYSPAFHLYSGTVQGYNILRCRDGEVNIYGGKITGTGTSMTGYAPATFNIYGGTFATTGRMFTLTPQTDEDLTLNIFDGTFTADAGILAATISGTSSVKNSQINIHISGGNFSFDSDATGFQMMSLASPTNVINANISGGTYRTKEVLEAIYNGFNLCGWVNFTVTKMDIITEGSAICADPLVNVTLDPAQDADIYAEMQGNSNSSIIYNTSLQNASMVNAEGAAVSAADYGKIVIKGGTFVSAARCVNAQISKTKVEILGGSFTTTSTTYYAVAGSGATELLIKGGTFTSPSNVAYVAGKLVIEGAPSFTGTVYIANSILDANDDYKLDASGYTGAEKIQVDVYNPMPSYPTIVLEENMIIAKGSADKLAFANTDWVFVDATDTAATPNAVVKVVCAGHKGDANATCTTAGTCTVCGASYTLAHTFGDWQTVVAATCTNVGTKAHKTCSTCQRHYDAEGVQIADLDIPIDTEAHTFGTWQAEVAATCVKAGTKAHKTCSACQRHYDAEGVQIADLAIPIDTEAHIFGQWTQTTAPTCTEAGVETRVCSRSDAHTDTRNIDATGHDFSKSEQDETAHWKGCSRCTAIDEKADHTYEKGVCACGYEKPGLSGGAIAGIAVGSTAVAGVGGFSLFWFVIKKKRWADLVNVLQRGTGH